MYTYIIYKYISIYVQYIYIYIYILRGGCSALATPSRRSFVEGCGGSNASNAAGSNGGGVDGGEVVTTTLCYFDLSAHPFLLITGMGVTRRDRMRRSVLVV